MSQEQEQEQTQDVAVDTAHIDIQTHIMIKDVDTQEILVNQRG